jgi:hypothetical protein
LPVPSVGGIETRLGVSDDDTSDEEMDIRKPPGKTLVGRLSNKTKTLSIPIRREGESQASNQGMQTRKVEPKVSKRQVKSVSNATNIDERSHINGIQRKSNSVRQLPSSTKPNKRKFVLDSDSPGTGEKSMPTKRKKVTVYEEYDEEEEKRNRDKRVNDMFGY